MAGADRWPRVEILVSHAEARGAIVDALVQERRLGGAEPSRAWCLPRRATAHCTMRWRLPRCVRRREGVAVVRATRCAQGRVLPKADEVLRDAGALTPVKARIALMLELLAATHPTPDAGSTRDATELSCQCGKRALRDFVRPCRRR